MSIKLRLGSDKSITIQNDGDEEIVDHVPAGVYRFKVTEIPMVGTKYDLLYRGKTLPIPEQRYGEHEEMVKTVVGDYDKLNPSIGAICTGLKGSGKSVLCNDICNRLLGQGIPTLVIEDPINVHHLRNIMAITGPCVLYFDEFGKNYTDKLERVRLLGLFSDQALLGYVFLLTANERSELSDFLIDRPGRIRYMFEMNDVTSTALYDFLSKNGIPKERATWLFSMRPDLTFDILQAIKNTLRASATFIEFRKNIRWLNVPYPNTYDISVLQVSHNTGIVADGLKAHGYIENNTIHLTVTDKGGVNHQFQRPLFNQDGRLSFLDRQHIACGEFTVVLDVTSRRLHDDDLLEGTCFGRKINKLGSTRIVPSNVERTDGPIEDRQSMQCPEDLPVPVEGSRFTVSFEDTSSEGRVSEIGREWGNFLYGSGSP